MPENGRPPDVVLWVYWPPGPTVELVARCGHCDAVLARRRIAGGAGAVAVRTDTMVDAATAAAHICLRR